MSEGRDVSWRVDGIDYAGLAWGDPTLQPALALHGWMDNALSFSALGPLLHHRQLIALDLSGHGLSSNRAPDGGYQLWDDIPQLLKLVDQLECDQISIIGHSRGAGVALLLALALGDRCDRLVMIDGLLWPGPRDVDAATQFRNAMRDRNKYEQRGERIFESLEAFVQARTRYGFSEDNARTLAPRALERVDAGYRLRADSRLFGSSVLRFNRETRHSFYQSLSMPVLGLFGDEGFFRNEPATKLCSEAAGCIPDYRSTILPGSHHLHLESEAEKVAWRIDSFIESGQ